MTFSIRHLLSFSFSETCLWEIFDIKSNPLKEQQHAAVDIQRRLHFEMVDWFRIFQFMFRNFLCKKGFAHAAELSVMLLEII